MNTRRHGSPWTYGNSVRLLENGEDFYPAVWDALASAQREVLIETFILFDDAVGRKLASCAIAAAVRGVRVAITVDDYGSAELPENFVAALLEAGVEFRRFDPRPRIAGMRTNPLRRLHRKIVVVDRRIGFIGGINFSIDHLRQSGAHSKQDYAVAVEGPIVGQLHRLVSDTLTGKPAPRQRPWWRRRASRLPDPVERGEGAGAILAQRDNRHHRDDIELHYRAAIHHARREVLIANAYFFPGYRLVRELRHAAKRGVRVRLLLQGGQADSRLARWAAQSLYATLARAGIVIYEYCERPLHGKVAVIDDRWSTVGSSNLDPTSLSLNLEANLIFDDLMLAATLRESLERLIADQCREIEASSRPPQLWWRRLLGNLVFHLMRRFPRWDRALPQREQLLVAIDAVNDAGRASAEPAAAAGTKATR